MTARQIIVVDVETSGLIPGHDVAVEVAWWNLTTDEHGRFVPCHVSEWVLAEGDPQALEINGYRNRLANAEQDVDGVERVRLGRALHGQTLAGSNPSFDVDFLRPMFKHGVSSRPSSMWHHRLLDLSAYAAGMLRLPPSELPGLSAVCELLGVENTSPYTAEGDVGATGRCFRKLFKFAGVTEGSA